MITRKEFLREMTKATAAAAIPFSLNYKEKLSLKSGQPNILWITWEDTSSQFIGCYGNKLGQTPNIDRLASQSVRFTSAFSTAPVCSPSRSTIITGCLTEMLGTGHHRSYYPIPDFIKGFPYYLKREGYFTSNNLKTDYNIGNKNFVHEMWDECFGNGGWGTSYGDNTDTFYENYREAGWWHRKPDQPFFSVFNLMNSHQSRTMTFPYKWYSEKVLGRLSAEEIISPDEIKIPPFYRDTPEMRREVSRVYNSLRLTDKEFGGIIACLEKDGLKEDTIIFCFADHGEGIPKGKTSAVVLGFQVPFFIYFPPKFQHLSPWPIGQTTNELVSTSEDVAPTVLSIAGVNIPEYMTGRPLAGIYRKPPRPFVWGARNRIDESPDVSRCVTDGRLFYTRVFMPQLPMVEYMKYEDVANITRTIRADYASNLLNPTQAELVEPRRPIEYLYDIQRDTWQIDNLATNPEYRSQLQKMRKILQGHLLETKDILFMPEYEMAQRSQQTTPYEFRMNEESYPLGRILDAANLIGHPSSIKRQLELLKDGDATVRYWAAVGLDAQGDGVKPFRKDIDEGLNDPHPSVRIVMAGIAHKLYQDPEGQKVIEEFLQERNEHLILHTLQIVEYSRDKAKPFIPILNNLLEQFSETKGNLAYDIKSIIQVILYFLSGEPLYYKDLKRWTPEAQMKINPSIHFI